MEGGAGGKKRARRFCISGLGWQAPPPQKKNSGCFLIKSRVESISWSLVFLDGERKKERKKEDGLSLFFFDKKPGSKSQKITSVRFLHVRDGFGKIHRGVREREEGENGEPSQIVMLRGEPCLKFQG